MAQSRIRVGKIENVNGEVVIAGGDIYKGYTAEQVSVLLTQITSTFQLKPFDGRCPYKGLDPFEEEDAELFFGRASLVDDLVSRLRQARTLFITGPSGSGKSSLVRAGLIPALKRGAIKNSEHWRYETMKPGRDPLSELGRVASSLAGNLGAGEDIHTKGLNDATVLSQWCEIALKEGRDKRVVLFIDQLEEVFTQLGQEDERLAFLNLLTYAATVENGRAILLFAMRSDFVSNCAAYPGLNALLNRQSAFAQIGSMQPDELVSAIAQPALRVGLRIDPDLIAQIINDMEGEPGALPLVQFALKDLFDAQQEKGGSIALTLNDYLQRGGIHRSLERHADRAFTKLSENEQALAQSIFSGLIAIGRGTQDTRRTALFDELIPADAPEADVRGVVQKLADARLITTDEQAGKDTVTISHEKLIEAWPWLKKLVNENREAIALQNQIAEDAYEWDEHQRDVSYLYTGARLANVREQLMAKKIMLSGSVQAFVEAGIQVEEAQRQRDEALRQKELDDARQLAEAAEARLRAEHRARRGLQVLATVLALLTVSLLMILARPYVLRSMAQGEMALIDAGPVVIGTNDPEASEEEMPEWTAHLATFEIDRFEVSNYQYSLCVKAGTCQKPIDPTQFDDRQFAQHPVVGVTAFQADTFCRWLGKRLPTELEWERAARGPDGRDWPWGDTPPSPEYANLDYDNGTDGELKHVDSLPGGASPEGVFNLVGNAWEWTSSYMNGYVGYYDETWFWDSRLGPPEYGLVQRGGSWDDNTLLRVTRRDSITVSDIPRQVGIRCAKGP